MSDSDENKTRRRTGKSSVEGGEENGDEKISPPEINLPVPDEFNTSMTDTSVKQADARARAKAEKQRRKQKRRGHPTDTYEPLKKRKKGRCGCIWMFLVVVFLVIFGVPLYFSSWAIKPYKDAGYEVVKTEKSGQLLTVTEAPDVETIYTVRKVSYQAESTPKKIVFVGSDVTISGTFADKVTFKGGKLTIVEGTLFQGDLEVHAIQMIDEGSTCQGELMGSVLMQE
ncbi:MAG: hypothetical protein ACKVJU_16595 [Verrucomicrobiales bacterium]